MIDHTGRNLYLILIPNSVTDQNDLTQVHRTLLRSCFPTVMNKVIWQVPVQNSFIWQSTLDGSSAPQVYLKRLLNFIDKHVKRPADGKLRCENYSHR
jgi:hypothetical protein